MKLIEAVIRHSRLGAVKEALAPLGIHGITVTEVKGFGNQPAHTEVYRGKEVAVDLVPKLKLEIALEAEEAEKIVTAIQNAACTGNVGDGKIFVTPLESVRRIRTGEEGRTAL